MGSEARPWASCDHPSTVEARFARNGQQANWMLDGSRQNGARSKWLASQCMSASQKSSVPANGRRGCILSRQGSTATERADARLRRAGEDPPRTAEPDGAPKGDADQALI